MQNLGRRRVLSLGYPGEEREILGIDLPDMDHKVAFMLALARQFASEPEVREYAIELFRGAGVPSRDYQGQAAAVLADMQSMYYLPEHEETFQAPPYTLKKRFGDCDDFTICAASLLESIRIPCAMEVIGWDSGNGAGFQYRHVYPVVGFPPSAPTLWLPMETTMDGAPLGFDPVQFVAEKFGKVAKTRRFGDGS